MMPPTAPSTAVTQLLAETWNWEPSVIVGCLALLALYVLGLRPDAGVTQIATWPRFLSFLFGDLAILFALVSPLDVLGDTYLFSAHMLQHLLLLSVAPPLLLLGLPPAPVAAVLRHPLLAQAERILGRPGTALAIGVGTLWAWHIPALFNATLADERVHVAEHLSFLVSATILWWPVVAPGSFRRLEALSAALYLFLAMAGDALLGILITFTPPGLYPAYLHPDDVLGILPLLRDRWGLSPAVDQQLAGILMWVPGSLVYLAGILAILVRWFEEPEDSFEDLFDGT
jgi:cytochrome c oxidase assembly factor CtaG